jgi:spermidine/putrescine transport system permease protein
MAAADTTTAAVRSDRPRGWRARRVLARWTAPTLLALFFLYLLIPIIVMLVMSFNDPSGRFSFTWDGFTLDAWADPLSPPGMSEALRNTLVVAVLSTLTTVVLGTLLALGLARYRFRSRGVANLLVLLPLTTPETIFGAGLLIFFIETATSTLLRDAFGGASPFYPTGMVTLVVAHTTFTMAFVVITVRSRILGLDPHLEEAARDLGASELTTFARVTLPLLAPGVLSGALLALTLSIDDFIVSQFTSGSTSVLPLWILGSLRNQYPSEIWALGSIIFLCTASIGLVAALRSLRLARAQRSSG